MKAVIIIPIFNRPEYLDKCLASLRAADLSDCALVLVNDASTDRRTIAMFEGFHLDGVPILKITNTENKKVYGSLHIGIDIAQEVFNPEYYINLDSDAIVKPNFVSKLIEVKQQFPNNIVTGFNSRTRNRDGSERHIVITETKEYNFKKSVGGVNLCFSKEQIKIVTDVLSNCTINGGNWDHKLSIAQLAAGNPMVCIRPSVVQHIGFKSSMGHTHNEQPDIAEDFDEVEKLELPNVTLFILDNKNIAGAEHAIEQSTKNIAFGEVVYLSDIDLNSKEEYSNFMVRDLANYVKTDFVLVIQADGFILNSAAWDNNFLNYDYIGAPWWFNDKMNVGNGGFSLRSKKLLDLLANDHTIKQTHPEDEIICRTYGEYLKSKGIKFAPTSVAEKFSIEAHGLRDKEYKGQFGFHGFGVRFTKYPHLRKIVPIKPIERQRSRGHKRPPNRR